MPRLTLFLGAAALLLGPSPALAADPEPLAVPLLAGFALDGRPDEPAWKDALLLPADPVSVPPAPPGTEPVRLVPDVRVAQSEGRLWFGVSMAEDPGMGMGLRVLIGPDGIASAAEAVQIAFAPQDVRSARWTVRGPRGLTREKAYRAEGAADAQRRGSWSLEVALPLDDLALKDPAQRLRLALAVDSRTQNLGSGVPAGTRFALPQGWALLQPAGGAWSQGARVDGAALAREDAQDEVRLAAYRAFDAGQHQRLPPGPPEAVRAQVEEKMLAPLAKVAEARPDLAAWVAWVRGDVFGGLGEAEQAEASYRAALAAMPGCREAAFALHVKLIGEAYAEGLPEQPSDYAAALGRAAAAEAASVDPYAREGARLARGLLLYKQGAFLEARDVLAPLAKRYPSYALLGFSHEHAKGYLDAAAQEALLRKAEDAQGDLPRVRVTTSKGALLLDLFEDDAPNTVKNFVWLAEHGFYDGTALHRNVPFLCLQGGDPFTKEKADPQWVGGGGPGYAIPTEAGSSKRRRLPLRGVIAMASRARDTEGSQFFLTTGTSAHLEGTVSVFGRIVEGQEVLDALVQGDRILRVEVLRRRPGTEYRPRTLAQAPAPEPVATPTPGR